MKKLITANDIREAHARGEQAMSVVLRASIITPEAREVADLLGFTITECDESTSVTGKGGIKVIDGSSVKSGRFDGAQPHCVGLTDLVTGDDGSSMAAGFMQWENAFFPWTLNYDEIDMVLEGELHVRHEGETMIAKAGDVMFIPKGSSIEFGTTSSVKFLYVAWPANWQSL